MLIEIQIFEAKDRYSFCKFVASNKCYGSVVAVVEKCVIIRVRTCVFDGEVLRVLQHAGISSGSVGLICYNDDGMAWSKELIDPALRNYSWGHSNNTSIADLPL